MNVTLHQFKAEFLKAMAHPARIAILELLRPGEQTVGGVQAILAMEPSSVSQQLAILRSHQIVEGRKAGTSVYYRVRDPQVFTVLDAVREIFEQHVQDLQDALAAEPAWDAGPPRGRSGSGDRQRPRGPRGDRSPVRTAAARPAPVARPAASGQRVRHTATVARAESLGTKEAPAC